MSGWDIAGLAFLVTAAFLIGRLGRGYRRGFEDGYREGWKKRERYGEGGRARWLSRYLNGQRIKGQSRGFWR